jgi:hypothetical protein
VIHLVKSVNVGSLRGYLWQKSIAGYHYELEVLDKEGEEVHSEELHDKSAEQALSELDSVMKALSFTEELRIYEEFA